ncbi:hypothetical protein [Streptomyces melanogenes]|uniref:hypothetical protein n=1 Tax=Streptomyces melanogenes TaxID=67326 RepID=UPI0037B44E09
MKKISFGRVAKVAVPAAAALALVTAGDATAATEYTGHVTASYGNATLMTYATNSNLGLQTVVADTAADSHSVQLNWSVHLAGGEQVADDSFEMGAGSGSGQGRTFWYSPSTLKGNTTGYIEYNICKYSGGFNSSCTQTYSMRFDIS